MSCKNEKKKELHTILINSTINIVIIGQSLMYGNICSKKRTMFY